MPDDALDVLGMIGWLVGLAMLVVYLLTMR
jgi:hypothetical protein